MRQQKPESSSWEHSLDEYCYGFLSEESLDFRDRDQVITRYFKNYTGEQNLPRLQDTSSTKNPLEDCDEILVVSRFWIWVFGGKSLALDLIISRCDTYAKQKRNSSVS